MNTTASGFDTFHSMRTVDRSNNLATATTMVAANVTSGRRSNTDVASSTTRSSSTAVIRDDSGVRAPAPAFTEVREKPPVTGTPPNIADPMLASPIAYSSWVALRGTTLFGYCMAMDLEIEMLSMNPTKLMTKLGMANCCTSFHHDDPMPSNTSNGDGNPVGMLPTTLMPSSSRLNAATNTRLTTTTMRAVGVDVTSILFVATVGSDFG